MTQPADILLPMVALAALTAAVWVRLYVERLGEMARRGIDPQAIATSRARDETLRKTAAADNFRNLLELPVLFYALCLALVAADAVSPLFVGGAWVYVALRAVHSAIHCTYNGVVHRFLAYVASSVVLFGLWGAFGAVLLGR